MELPEFEKLDRTIHERGRLSIMTLLAARRQRSFADLKCELGMSDGNLISHLRTLQNAGYVGAQKRAAARPSTFYRLTRRGREAFNAHLDVMDKIVRLGRG